ncbi:hypothetical protein RFI_31115 [Reticulomyxa filosa]|uniref:PH domain-containing protein n=1 Tax=Reticulomyxa filosa TaxID=46433 RepID=X6LWH4_RETFI|nr:hypothetical protein RFI_31115 [Reticulomyxa filosa]|eukprot:ETO06283.1 hypothetical protein RFI_31115 [Reticulomyxa filosa]
MGTDLETPFKKDLISIDPSLKEEMLCQYRHDLLVCLLEWVARKKTLAIVIDEIQYLDTRDWQLTRRLSLLMSQNIVKNIVLLLGGMPMDNRRYLPHFTKEKRILEYIDLRNTAHITITPRLWTWNQTKEWIINSLHVKDCSKQLVDSVYFECGGRPGFCEEFLHTLKESKDPWIQILVNKTNGTDKIVTLNEVIEEKLKVGVDVPFPIPPYIQSVTAAHLDCLTTELFMCMKTAAVICKAKGNRNRQFEEEMLRGTHPVPKMAEKHKLRESLLELKNMGFIRFVDSSQRGLGPAVSTRNGIDEDVNDKKYEHEEIYSKVSPTSRMSSVWYNNKPNHDETETQTNVSTPNKHASKRATTTTITTLTTSTATSLDHELSGTPEIDHDDSANTNSPIGQSKTSANRTAVEADEEGSGGNASNKSNIYERRSSSIVDQENNDPMPSTLSLLQPPIADVPYKKGQLYKRGVTSFNFSEKLRFFVFKHHTLYWFKDTNKEHYPVNRIKFTLDMDVKLKRLDDLSLKIQTSRKKYILRAEKKNEMDEWHDLFKKAIKAEDRISSPSAKGRGKIKLDFGSSRRSNLINGEVEEAEDSCSDSEEECSDGHTYEFSYGFLRDVIYEQMLHAQRQQLHNQANKFIQQILSKEYDRGLALLRERHEELGSDKYCPREDEDLFTSHTKLRKKRQSKYIFVNHS